MLTWSDLIKNGNPKQLEKFRTAEKGDIVTLHDPTNSLLNYNFIPVKNLEPFETILRVKIYQNNEFTIEVKEKDQWELLYKSSENSAPIVEIRHYVELYNLVKAWYDCVDHEKVEQLFRSLFWGISFNILENVIHNWTDTTVMALKHKIAKEINEKQKLEIK